MILTERSHPHEALQRELEKLSGADPSVASSAERDVVLTVNSILEMRGAVRSKTIEIFSHSLTIEAEYCHDAYEGLRRSGYGASANESDAFGPNMDFKCNIL